MIIECGMYNQIRFETTEREAFVTHWSNCYKSRNEILSPDSCVERYTLDENLYYDYIDLGLSISTAAILAKRWQGESR